MNPDKINKLLEKTQIRKKETDIPKIRSLIESAEETAKAAQTIPLNDLLATTIFESAYKAIKQLADAKWLLLGYESRSHDASMEILKDEKNLQFQHLERITTIRNDAYYRGYKATIQQAQDILQFWKQHCTSILSEMKTSLK